MKEKFNIGDEIWYVADADTMPSPSTCEVLAVHERSGYYMYVLETPNKHIEAFTLYSDDVAKTRQEILPKVIGALSKCKQRCIDRAFDHQYSIAKYQIQYDTRRESP